MRGPLIWLGKLVGLLTGGYLTYVALRGSRMLVRPEVRPFAPEGDADPTTPADLGLPYEVVRFTTEDGVTLDGWLVPAARETRAAVVLLHGFTGHRLPELAAFVPWLRRRYHVLQFDFRGHGASGGDLVTLGAYEHRDVAAAVRFLEGRGLGPIALMGISMGAAIAIIAAPNLRVAAVVADAPYAHLGHPITNRLREIGYPLAPLGAKLILAGAAVRARTSLPSPLRAVRRIAPRGLQLIAGREDRLISWRQAQALYDAAAEPKDLFVVDGAAHAESWSTAGAAYEERVLTFLERYLDGADTLGERPPDADPSVREAAGQRL
jgi:alpha-beta hydrolase superfamily lysophospholipase